MFMETDFWLYLRAQVNKYAVSTTVQNDSGYSNSSMESKWFDTMVDELKAFTCVSFNHASRKIPFKHTGVPESPQRLHSLPQ